MVVSVVCNRCFSSSQLPDTEGEMERIYEERCIRRGQVGANEMTQWVKAGSHLTTWV